MSSQSLGGSLAAPRLSIPDDTPSIRSEVVIEDFKDRDVTLTEIVEAFERLARGDLGEAQQANVNLGGKRICREDITSEFARGAGQGPNRTEAIGIRI